MIDSIKILIDGTIYDVSNEVLINSVEIGARADYSFEVGSFQMFTNQLSYNIPPYSLCEIIDDGQVNYFIISSEISAYLTNGKWTHNCSLLALESILEGYILGAKSFSLNCFANDYIVAQTIRDLLNQEIGRTYITIDIGSISTAKNEYTFPDGTTYYLAFKEIANKNNVRLKVSIEGLWNRVGGTIFKVSYVADSNRNIDLVDYKIQSFKMNQDTNNYCNKIICASGDVVDRNNTTKFKGLTVRSSNGVVISADTAEVILPCKVEGITKFEIYSRILIKNMLVGSPSFTADYVSNPDWSSGAGSDEYGGYIMTVQHTVYEWRMQVGDASTKAIWQQLYDLWLKNLSFDNVPMYVKYYSSGQLSGHGYAVLFTTDNQYGTSFIWTDATNKLKEKNEFDALNAADQPKYAVYESGSNRIWNFNASYKKDFWSQIAGITVEPFTTTFNYVNEVKDSCTIEYSWRFYSPVLQFAFNVECVPIANPLLVDSKNTTPLNESGWKPITRSYQMGDSNGFKVDFKALTNDMDRQNDTLGDVEGILELDSRAYIEGDDELELYIPRPNDYLSFSYNNTEYSFYITSLVARYTSTKKTYQLNLSRTKYKIADAIGVDYQFNPTWLPFENIVERPLQFEISHNNFASVLDNTYYIRVDFDTRSFYLLPAVMKAKGYWILYCECQDNIVIGMRSNENNADTRSIANIPYSDANGYINTMNINLIYTPVRTITSDSWKLPEYFNISTAITITVKNNLILKKDSREKLTFTIRVNDNNIS